MQSCGCKIEVNEASLDEEDLMKLLEKVATDKDYTQVCTLSMLYCTN